MTFTATGKITLKIKISKYTSKLHTHIQQKNYTNKIKKDFKSPPFLLNLFFHTKRDNKVSPTFGRDQNFLIITPTRLYAMASCCKDWTEFLRWSQDFC